MLPPPVAYAENSDSGRRAGLLPKVELCEDHRLLVI